METFPGPNFFTWQSYVAESPPVSPCAGATNHHPPANTAMSPASLKASVVYPNRFL